MLDQKASAHSAIVLPSRAAQMSTDFLDQSARLSSFDRFERLQQRCFAANAVSRVHQDVDVVHDAPAAEAGARDRLQ
ncbi:MAG: hypothetical protein ACP5P4_03405 [Steroidobacteraceae bacterium]